MKKSRWEEITELYHAALELPEKERAAFLDACANDDLRLEVSSLLANEGKADGLLEASALDAVARMQANKRSSLLGRQLGSFLLVSELGRGGMGEVYLAKDQKLGRDVAIKVLPEEFAQDADRVARFQREAKLLASLNHPNIAAIYDLEKSEGTNFLVLELVEGRSLYYRIKSGPVPVEEALKLALQIAEALEAAHEKGVIHRDLKPANIMVTPDGNVKVLDFGLAKAFAGEYAGLNISNSPTLSQAATMQGVVFGTAAYMSPEQAKGKTVDKRTDIWALGVILFEMLTGRRLFTGETVSEILAAVIKSEPEWNSLPLNLHPRIRLMLERCLEKDPKNRYSAVSDARVDIDKVLADPGGVYARTIAAAEPKAKLRQMSIWASITVILLIISGTIVWNIRSPKPPQVIRSYYDLPERQQFGSFFERALDISPDGSQVVYATDQGLYLRSMAQWSARHIAGTDKDSQQPFFSYDGQWIGYFSASDQKLKKVPVSGGIPEVLTEVSAFGHFDWRTDDTIVYYQAGRGIMRISANGGNPQTIVKSESENDAFLSPQILPDGESVLFTHLRPLPGKVMVQSLESGERKELFPGDTARYLPTGHIVYHSKNELFAIPFDLNKLEVSGEPVSLIQDVFREPAPQYAISDSGTLVYIPGTSRGTRLPVRTLVWVDRNGNEEPLITTPDFYSNPRISPDGRQVALTTLTVGAVGTNLDIGIYDLDLKIWTQLTFDPAQDWFPLWTPDGKKVAFNSYRDGISKIFWMSADRRGEAESLGSGEALVPLPSSWSDKGKTLVFTEYGAAGTYAKNIGALSSDGKQMYRALLKGKHAQIEPKISPDGRWMAYTSEYTGKNEIWVRPFPEVDSMGPWQVSAGGGTNPLWSPDGRELFYRSGDAVMAVPVIRTDPTFRRGKPNMLFQGTYDSLSASINTYDGMDMIYYLNSWDIHPDDGRFLMLKPAPASDGESIAKKPRKISYVVNWFEELKERVTTD